MSQLYVITAGPSAGKTSTLRELSKRGYRTFPESARIFIDQKISEGDDEEEIREKYQFQQILESIDIQMETKARGMGGVVFLDRSLADNIAYRRHFGKDVPQSLLDKCEGRYERAFLLERLPFEDDYARDEDEQEAEEIHEELRRTYEDINTPITEVPLMPVDERATLIGSEIHG